MDVTLHYLKISPDFTLEVHFCNTTILFYRLLQYDCSLLEYGKHTKPSQILTQKCILLLTQFNMYIDDRVKVTLTEVKLAATDWTNCVIFTIVKYQCKYPRLWHWQKISNTKKIHCNRKSNARTIAPTDYLGSDTKYDVDRIFWMKHVRHRNISDIIRQTLKQKTTRDIKKMFHKLMVILSLLHGSELCST